MNHDIEFDASYFHNPHSLGGELLPLYHLAKADGFDGVEGATGSDSGVSPLISMQSSDQFHVLCVFTPPLREIARGVLYIVGFRSRRVHGVQYYVETMHGGSGTHHMVQ
jgi:hypothetical protein